MDIAALLDSLRQVDELHDEEFCMDHQVVPGIVGVAIVALMFAASCGLERLSRKRIPDSNKFFWRGNILGAVFGAAFLTVYLFLGNNNSPIGSLLDAMPSMLVTGGVMGLIPGGILGLAIGWLRSKSRKEH